MRGASCPTVGPVRGGGANGFAAVETYPERGARENATSAATPGFWEHLGFTVAAADDRFPVMRRELA